MNLRREHKRHIPASIWLGIVLLGIVISMAITAMDISDNSNWNKFYNNGKIYEAYGTDLRYWTGTVSSEKGNMQNSDIPITKRIQLPKCNWRYMDINLKYLNTKTIDCVVQAFSGDILLTVNEVSLKQGENFFAIDGQKADSVYIMLKGKNGTEISVTSLKLYEYGPAYSTKRFWGESVLIFGIYMLVISFLLKKTSILEKFIKVTDDMTKGYLKLLCRVANSFKPLNMTETKKHYIRIFLWLVLILWTMVGNISKGVVAQYSKYIIVYALVMLGQGIVSWEKNKREVSDFDIKSIKKWLLFYGWICISDFMCPKSYPYVGYFFIVIAGLSFYMCCNEKIFVKMIKEFAYAVSLSFLFSALYCMVFHTAELGVRYTGVFTNANTFANYLVVVILSIFVLLESCLWKETKKYWSGLYILELVFSYYFLWMTQSRMANLLAVLLLLFFAIRSIRKFQVGFSEYWKKAVRLCAVLAVIVGVIAVCYMVPELSLTSNRMLNSFKSNSLDTFTSGRLTIWKGVLREMNFWGHKYKINVNGMGMSPHNLVLAAFSRYGLLSGVFFVVFWIAAIYKMMKYAKWHRDDSIALLPFLYCISYVFLASMDALEFHPWKYLGWAAAYICMGFTWMKTKEIET